MSGAPYAKSLGRYGAHKSFGTHDIMRCRDICQAKASEGDEDDDRKLG